MGAPATINYSAPRTRAREIAPSAGNININKALGLRSSPYEGLQQVGKQNLYYGKGGLYEKYSPSPVSFVRNSLPYGVQQTYSPTGLMPSTPSYHPIFGYSGGWQRSGGDVEGTIRIGNQAFRPSTNIPAGFIKVGDTYEPSVAYALSKSMPNIKAQPNRMFTTVTGYQPASRNLLSNLNVSSDSGAGQYLGSGLLGSGLNFGTPSGRTAG
jgi:hypothetical protein